MPGEELQGRPLPEPGPQIGFVFQQPTLLDWLSVRDNVLLPLSLQGKVRADDVARAEALLAQLGLGAHLQHRPRQLSGGQQSRVAIARALLPEPSILLMDEPFASIDAQTRELMQIELMRLWSRMRSLVLFVTHSVDEAILLADRIMLMGPRPGRIVEEIAVDLPRPRWSYDVRAEPRFLELRAYLWQRIRHFVLSDPASDFYGRDFGSTDPAPEAQNRAGKTSST